MSLGPQLSIFLIFLSTLAFAHNVNNDPSEVAPQIASIYFNPGIKTLTGKEKAELHRFASSIQNGNRVKSVKVLTWSDNGQFDIGDQTKSGEIKLAQARGESIRRFLKEDLNMDVRLYNMVESKTKKNGDLAAILKQVPHEDKASTTALISVMLE